MPTFDMFVVGAGGGQNEVDLSAYLLKPCRSNWNEGIVALEAGSGPGALNQLLRQNPSLFKSDNDPPEKRYTASEIYSFVQCFIISHAHLDHVSSLVISAGSLEGPRKRIYATHKTLQDLESVFSGRIWPNLASWDPEGEKYKLLYSELSCDGGYHPIFPDISIQSIGVNHGRNEGGQYDSTAFFVRDDTSGNEFLFFGDVEPDSVAPTPRTIDVWRLAAPKIPTSLSSIFIECSWPSGREDEMLYGHLSPEHLVAELTTLAREVVAFRRSNSTLSEPGSPRPPNKKRKKNPISDAELVGSLQGLKVYVIHCKDNLNSSLDKPSREIIAGQIQELLEKKALGAELIALAQGMSIKI